MYPVLQVDQERSSVSDDGSPKIEREDARVDRDHCVTRAISALPPAASARRAMTRGPKGPAGTARGHRKEA